MSSAVTESASVTTPDPVPTRRAGGKLDLWICYWTIPAFYGLFGLIFFVLARVMPPPKPGLSTEQMVDFVDAHSLTIKIGFGMLMVIIGFASVANGLIALQIKRMSVGPVFAYAYIVALAVGAIPGCLFCALSFLAAALRPDRDPEIIALLFDIGMMTFVGSLGCFATQYLVFALAVFLDKNGIFPKWLAYVTVWQIVTELMAAPIFVFTDGPFAWDGSISFWMGTAIFGFWQGCMIVLLYKAVKTQPADERVRD
jgi:hypothetical protein